MDLGCCLPLLAPAFRERLLGYLVPRELPAGTAIVREGERTAEMFFVVAGSARIRRDDLDVGTVGPGDHFGELGLLASLPRSASVVAGTPISLLSLDEDAYARLARDEPQLALSLVHVLVGGLAERLGEMTDRVSSLLRERSLPRRASVEVRTDGTTRRVATGTPAGSLLPRSIDGHPVVGALVARKPVSLDTPIASDASLAPITTAHWEGERIRRASLGLLLLEAARQVAPGAVRRLGPSQGGVQLVEITPGREGEGVDLHRLAETLAGAMRALVAADQPFLHEWWTVEEASAYFHEQGSADTTLLLQVWREAMVPLVSCGETRAISFGPVVPRTRDVGPFQLEADREGIYLVTSPTSPGSAGRHGRVVRPAAEAMTSEHARWLDSLGVTSVGAFARACVRGEVNQLVRISEGFHEKRISRIADEIASRRDRVKVICIAGPSSSGKTTFIKRLTVQLQVAGLVPTALSLDDYYVDREKTPRDEHGEYDFEAFDALDVALLHDELGRLLRGESVRVSRFDFRAGKSLRGGGAELRLGHDQVLLLEGIHGLNPGFLGPHVGHEEAFRIFVCPLTALPFDACTRVSLSDLRLMRRIVRDRHQRSQTAADTIARWPSVRLGERRHIFPFFDHADAVFDSSLAYEPAVLKVFAERYLLEVPPEHASYPTAYRLLELVSRFVAIQPDHVPPTSILREFVGGSGFEY